MIGDHYIPRSAYEQGGVTTWENLVVTSNYNNRTIRNMTPEMFPNEETTNESCFLVNLFDLIKKKYQNTVRVLG